MRGLFDERYVFWRDDLNLSQSPQEIKVTQWRKT